MASYRSGVDLVMVAAPSKVAWAINALSPDILTTKMKGDYFSNVHIKDLVRMSEKYHAVLIGNGVTLQAKSFVQLIVKELVKRNKPIILDADAIKAVRIQDLNNCILTPHYKELDLLLENSRLYRHDLKKHMRNNVILLKGEIDDILSAKKEVKNKTGNAGMTVGGTGDVLAGICTGFVAQGNDLFTSACAGAYINGQIGDVLARSRGVGFVASDFLELIPVIIQEDFR